MNCHGPWLVEARLPAIRKPGAEQFKSGCRASLPDCEIGRVVRFSLSGVIESGNKIKIKIITGPEGRLCPRSSLFVAKPLDVRRWLCMAKPRRKLSLRFRGFAALTFTGKYNVECDWRAAEPQILDHELPEKA